MKKLTYIALMGLLLTGCKVEIEKALPLSKVLEPVSTEYALLNIEVAGCNDFQDSRQPSSSLLEAQQAISSIFSQAQFKECYSKNFNSYAAFDIPVTIGKYDASVKTEDLQDIFIFSYKNEKGEIPLGIMFKESAQKRLKQLKKREIMANSLDFSVTLNVKNDLIEDKTVKTVAAYVNGKPQQKGIKINFKTDAGKTFNIKLSNVSVDDLLEGDGFAVVITEDK